MIIGIPKERHALERRVAGTPASVKKLVKLGYEVHFESGCGDAAKFSDEDYQQSGAQKVDEHQIWSGSDIIICVRQPEDDQIDKIRGGSVLIGFLWPATNPELLERLAERKISAFSMDAVPRISRAQKLDALSSMANIAGYRAVIEAAHEFGRFFTGQITAAGKMPPAKVLVIGAGVAGLAALGAANGLGAVVRAFDTREAVRDQVKSMGAEFLHLEMAEAGEGAGGYAKQMSDDFLRKEQELFEEQAKEVDVIITTALIPGKPAPKLITEQAVKNLRRGSVIVDLAAEQGGNCELTKPGEVAEEHGVKIIGYTDLPSRLPTEASTLYGNNIVNFFDDLTPQKDGEININTEDEVIRGALVVHHGEVTWPPPKIEQPEPPKPKSDQKQPVSLEPTPPETEDIPFGEKVWWTAGAALLSGVLLLLAGYYAPPDFTKHFTVFVLSCFIGWQVIWNVNPALHTPLMSVTNAISGIIVVGAMAQMKDVSNVSIVLASLAILVAAVNIGGGFYVTQRMLAMFQKKG